MAVMHMVRSDVVSLRTCLTLAVIWLLILPQAAGGQTPSQSIPVNLEYAFPTKDTASGIEVNSASLVENANLWNGRTVSFKGEAIGEVMIQGHMAWMHMNDDSYMEKSVAAGGALTGYNSGHAIWLPAQLAGKIRVLGDYRHQGDIVKVVGVFNAACPEHGGDMDIHATSLESVSAGRSIAHPVSSRRGLTSVGLFACAGGLYWLRRKAVRQGL